MNCRLVYLVGQLGAGGLERQLFSLLQAMDRERYRPAVAVWNFSEKDFYTDQIRALGVPVHPVASIPSVAAKLVSLSCAVKQLQPEVMHSYSFYTNFAAYWATWCRRAVAIGSVRSDFIGDKQTAGPWVGRLSARWPGDQICNSKSAAKTAKSSSSPFVPPRLSVVRNGLDLRRFQNVPPLIPGPIRILGVGSLLPVKRWDRLLRLALELKRHQYDCLVQIVGDGPLRESLERQAKEIGLAGRVEFRGRVNDIATFLSDASFLVHTSETEGCPNVVMEAMAAGRAVVATDAGDTPDLVEDGKTGFVVRRGDDAMLFKRVVKLIKEHDLCRCMGEAGRAKAEREFGFDRLVAETFAAYRAAGWKD